MSRWSMRDVLAAVVTASGVSAADLMSESRRRHLTLPRMAAIILMREAGHSYGQIGKSLGRDHTTVLMAQRRAQEAIQIASPAGEKIELLMQAARRHLAGGRAPRVAIPGEPPPPTPPNDALRSAPRQVTQSGHVNARGEIIITDWR